MPAIKGTRLANYGTYIKGAEGINFTGAKFIVDSKAYGENYAHGVKLDGEFNNAIFKGTTFVGYDDKRKPWKHPWKNIEIDIEGKNINFENVKLRNVRITEFPFAGNKFNNLYCIQCIISYCDFRDSIISEVDFSSSLVKGTKFNNAVIKKANFSETNQQSNKYVNTTIRGANFSNSRLHNCDFTKSDLSNSIFDNSSITWSKFDNAKLRNSSFKDVQNLKKNTFINANVNGIK